MMVSQLMVIKKRELNHQIGLTKVCQPQNHTCISKKAHIHITTKNLWARKDHLFQLHCGHPGHQQLPPTSAPVSCYGSAKTELKSGHSSARSLPTPSHLTQSKGIISFKGVQVCPGSSSPPAHLLPHNPTCFYSLYPESTGHTPDNQPSWCWGVETSILAIPSVRSWLPTYIITVDFFISSRLTKSSPQ